MNGQRGVQRVERNRLSYATAAVLVAALGLLSRSILLPLSTFISKYSGDAFWALLVFVLFGFLFKLASTLRISLAALSFSWLVEFSQLYHAPWIDSVRATMPGRLILGFTFNGPDLIAYAIGIAIGAFGETVLVRRSGS